MNEDEKIKCDCGRNVPLWQLELEMKNDSPICNCKLVKACIKFGRKLERDCK
jgi:hypothetical protein